MSKIVGKALPDMPWQDKDENDKLPVWRYKANPIIDRFATRIQTAFLTVRSFRLKMDMQEYSAATADRSVWISLQGLVKTGSIGIFRMIRSYSTVMMKRLEKEITDMIREYVL